MRDSIGGNSKTLMFVNISPADYNSEETKMSLFYGSTAKEIKNEVHKNIGDQEVLKLKQDVRSLQYENKQLRDYIETRVDESQDNFRLSDQLA